jgi:hypothetical protein
MFRENLEGCIWGIELSKPSNSQQHFQLCLDLDQACF